MNFFSAEDDGEGVSCARYLKKDAAYWKVSGSQSADFSVAPQTSRKDTEPDMCLDNSVSDTSKPNDHLCCQLKSVIDKPIDEARSLSEPLCDNNAESSIAKLPSAVSSCDAAASENIVRSLQLTSQPDVKKVRANIVISFLFSPHVCMTRASVTRKSQVEWTLLDLYFADKSGHYYFDLTCV